MDTISRPVDRLLEEKMSDHPEQDHKLALAVEHMALCQERLKRLDEIKKRVREISEGLQAPYAIGYHAKLVQEGVVLAEEVQGIATQQVESLRLIEEAGLHQEEDRR